LDLEISLGFEFWSLEFRLRFVPDAVAPLNLASYASIMQSAAVTAPGEVDFDQTEFNVARWTALLEDPELARIENRIETDRFGQIIMSPLPAPSHGNYQSEISYLLRRSMPEGRTITECPISTSEGVKGADVVWISRERRAPMDGAVCFTTAPEICVEVLSPSNSKAEIAEKKRLYFEAGAEEVWICDGHGKMEFFVGTAEEPESTSKRCPEFPGVIELEG